jgi:hypothetical protein
MRGDAEKWAILFIRKYIARPTNQDNYTDDDKKIIDLMEDWDTFKEKLRQVFSPIKESVVAKQRI